MRQIEYGLHHALDILLIVQRGAGFAKDRLELRHGDRLEQIALDAIFYGAAGIFKVLVPGQEDDAGGQIVLVDEARRRKRPPPS